MNTFQILARELAGAFVTGKRADGAEFYLMKSEKPLWMESLPAAVHSAVDGPDCRFPSDWIYSLMAHAADFLAEHETAETARDAVAEFADGQCDVYTARLFAWAADNAHNRELCDAAVAEYGQPGDGFDSATVERFFRMGQYLGAERVAIELISAIETETASVSE